MFGFGKKQQEPEQEQEPEQGRWDTRVLKLSLNMSREEMAEAIAEYEGTSVEEVNVDDWYWVPFWRRKH